MSGWRLEEGSDGLRLAPVVRRALGSEEFTWADLLYLRLSAVYVFVLYFPSRFDLPADAIAKTALQAFGQRTGPGTSINFWDSTDPEFSKALGIFDVKAPPALVLAGTSKADRTATSPIDPADLYAISITAPEILGDAGHLALAVNNAHEVLMRGNPKEITRYLRQQAASSLLVYIGTIAGGLRDELLKCKPKFGLPGGISLQLG
jgi:hypothetical protein